MTTLPPRIATVQWASDIAAKPIRLSDLDPYPAGIEPYTSGESYSAKLELQCFDLITPDGERAWVIAGWDDAGNLHAWTVQDFIAERQPTKSIPDAPDRFAPLTLVNSAANLREDFIRDFAALNHGVGEQEFAIGLPAPSTPSDWVNTKIYPFGASTECIVRDYDSFYRTLTVDPVRAGNPEHYQTVDIWEVTASWHLAHQSRPVKRAVKEHSEGQFLYRLYNRAGFLLYVGITDNVFRRWKEHSRDKPWWSEVHKFTQDWFPDRAAVEAAERHAISSERPLYNVVGAVRAPRNGRP